MSLLLGRSGSGWGWVAFWLTMTFGNAVGLGQRLAHGEWVWAALYVVTVPISLYYVWEAAR